MNKKVIISRETIFNIFSNFILHETIYCDNRDPLWRTSSVKQLIAEKNSLHRNFVEFKFRGIGNNESDLKLFNTFENKLTSYVKESKQKYNARFA